MAKLPQNETADQLQIRNEQLTTARNDYKYKYNYHSLPSVAMADGLPLAELPSLGWAGKVLKVLLKLLANNVISDDSPGRPSGIPFLKKFNADKIFEKNKIATTDGKGLLDQLRMVASKLRVELNPERPEDIKDFEELFSPVLGLPISAHSFQMDYAFARMRIAGQNPVALQKMDKLDPQFPVTDEMLKAVEGFGGDNLKNALKQGRLYIADYKELSNLKNDNGSSGQKYIYSPKALFAIPENSISLKGNLCPIAIQCAQTPGLSNKQIFTPRDGQAWMIAKTIVQIADFSHHEIVTHLCGTHLFIEPFVVSTHRQLAKDHPLFQLLIPHFEGTILINWGAQEALVNDGGPFNQIFGGTIQTYRNLAAATLNWNFKKEMFPEKMKAKGLDNPLLKSPYYEDGSLVWEAIKQWVTSYIQFYYPTNQMVARDTELSAWVDELQSDKGGKIKGLGPIKTAKELIDAVTMIIFTASAQHAAVNFSQEDYSGFPPTMPAAGYHDIPKDKKSSFQDWLNILPPLNMAKTQIQVTHLLSGVYYTQLGYYEPDQLEDEPTILKAEKQFKAELKAIEQKITDRNKKEIEEGIEPYTYLLPSKIPQSINI